MNTEDTNYYPTSGVIVILFVRYNPSDEVIRILRLIYDWVANTKWSNNK